MDNHPEASSRTVCEIFEDMRRAHETRNFSYLLGLIEEAQYRANRMENAIEKYAGWDGIVKLEQRRIALKEEIKKLRAERNELKPDTVDSDD